MVHLIVAYNILEVSTVTGQDQGSPDGPIVATGFTEMIMLTEPYADGTDPSYGPPVSRSLPDDPDMPWTPWQRDEQD